MKQSKGKKKIQWQQYIAVAFLVLYIATKNIPFLTVILLMCAIIGIDFRKQKRNH